MTSNIDHVTFRPGELIVRLGRGHMAPGAIAKRDLTRYYVLLDTTFDMWINGWTMTDEAWAVIVDFAATRAWDTIPYPEVLAEQFRSFLASAMGQRHESVARSMAATALLNADYPEVVAIIDRATTPVAATADATSVA